MQTNTRLRSKPYLLHHFVYAAQDFQNTLGIPANNNETVRKDKTKPSTGSLHSSLPYSRIPAGIEHTVCNVPRQRGNGLFEFIAVEFSVLVGVQMHSGTAHQVITIRAIGIDFGLVICLGTRAG